MINDDRLFDAYERECDVIERQHSMGQITREERDDQLRDLERDAREEARYMVSQVGTFYGDDPNEY
jgi:hypothetical protein